MFGDDLSTYLPEHIRPFAKQLKQFPLGYEKWVYAASVAKDTYQGDVFGDLPFVLIDDEGDVARAEGIGMLISNTCDSQLDQSEVVLVAEVIELDDYREQSDLKGEALENHIRALVGNQLSQMLYLPEIGALGNAFVDFGKMSSVSTKYFHERSGDLKLLSLSQYGHYFFLMKLAYHLARPEGADINRSEAKAGSD